MKKYQVGILGATGMVGQRFVSILENHPWFEIKVLAASARSAGKSYGEVLENRWIINSEFPEKFKNFIILDVCKDMKKIADLVDFVFCAVNLNKIEIKKLEESYAKLECPVISNNSAHRFTPDVPMVIPEINPEHLEIINFQRKRLNIKKGFIAVKSNCSLQCYIPALHALKNNILKKALVCTCQAISGAGKTFNTWNEMQDNLIPFIPEEEKKSELEPLKIWGKIKKNKIELEKNKKITSLCLRVPVSDGHTAAVFASFHKKISPENIIYKWENFESKIKKYNLPSAPKKFLNYFHEPDMPQIQFAINLENGMAISLGRLQEDSQYDIKFICMSHNTIRGAAGGAVLLAELLCVKNYL